MALQRDQPGDAWMASVLLNGMAEMYSDKVHPWCEEAGLCANNMYHMMVDLLMGAFPGQGAKQVTVLSSLLVSICMPSNQCVMLHMQIKVDVQALLLDFDSQCHVGQTFAAQTAQVSPTRCTR